MFRTVYFALFALLFLTVADAGATTKPWRNADESGVRVCAEAVRRESEIFLKDKPHESHDFVAPLPETLTGARFSLCLSADTPMWA